jgi:hypothetical protein
MRGPAEFVHLQGKRVENIWSSGCAGLEIMYVVSYAGKLNIGITRS